MIHFVWPLRSPLLFGRGGSETYTVGHARELLQRGISCDIITTYLGEDDGRDAFPDVPFRHIEEKNLSALDGTVIFVGWPIKVKTKNLSYVIFHVPPSSIKEEQHKPFCVEAAKDKVLIATSHISSNIWSSYLGRPVATVYPFASPEFSQVKRLLVDKPTILFAGRLSPHKGIYTLLSAMHFSLIEKNYQFIFTTASSFTPDGKIIEKLIRAHPHITVEKARTTPKEMAKLLAKCTMLVMPTSPKIFLETFGMLSVEAQHAGCRVVGANQGGIPETSVGGLTLVEPDNPIVLAKTILDVAKQGPLTEIERDVATDRFTLVQSVDALLEIINY